ncbi:MAG: phospholipase [Burkholderiaceae bacterium]|nr:phospholipase [Burkholderiaceae bacterium]
MRGISWRLAALAAAAVVSACGGGGSDGPGSAAHITSVKVMGDSLSDGGALTALTGSRSFTVQGSSAEPSVLWVERVNANLGLAPLCSFYRFSSIGGVTPTPGCTNYAVGGSRVNSAAQQGGQPDPFSVVYQLQTAASAGNGYAAGDLLLVDGGANDAADLIGAYLAAASDGGASYQQLLLSLLPAATVQQLLSQGSSGAAQAGGVYMSAIADLLYGTLKTQALDKGAQHVAVLNAPAITLTPRFQMVLKSIAAAQGQAAADSAAALFDTWVQAFNAQLAKNAGSDSRVLVIDFYTDFRNEVADPAQYGITNATTPACPITGQDSTGLPTYTFATCTAAALSANPPQGASGAGWWQNYAFSDSFHPTPYGHQLMSELTSRALAAKGWL